MITLINFLNRFGFGRGKLKKFNNIILKFYLKKNNSDKIEYKYYGKNFILYPLDNATDNKMIISSKKYENEELKYLKNLKKNDKSVFLDIGANMGYYSIMSSNYGFKKIYAFEPAPKMINRIQKNIKINNLEKLIEIIPYAIGEEKKDVIFYEEPTNHGGSSLFQASQRTKEIKVQMLSLNEFISNNSIKNIDALKIDIEGYEDRALMPFFKNSPINLLPKLIIIEHSSLNEWKDDIIDWMINNNYLLVYKSRGNSVLKYQKH
jgi:FkbM family methyltransferase